MYNVLNWWSGLNVEKIIYKKFKVQFGYINEIFNITYQGQKKIIFNNHYIYYNFKK